MTGRLLLAIVLAVAAMAASPALAHPHILINAKTELVFNGRALAAIRHTWQFDEPFSAFAVQGLDDNYDGRLSAEELAPLAELNMKGLAEYGYYTNAIVDQKAVEFGTPRDYRVEWNFGQLTLFFTLPLKALVEVQASAAVEVFDLEYYTAFNFSAKEPFSLTGAPAGCVGSYVKPQPPDAATLLALYSIPANQHNVPPELRQTVGKLANIITVTCS